MKRIMAVILILFFSVGLYAQRLAPHPLTGKWKVTTLNDIGMSGVIEIKNMKFIYSYNADGKLQRIEYTFWAYVDEDDPYKYLNMFYINSPFMNRIKYVFKNIDDNCAIIMSEDEVFYCRLDKIK